MKKFEGNLIYSIKGNLINTEALVEVYDYVYVYQ